jgi:hypothetical protein
MRRHYGWLLIITLLLLMWSSVARLEAQQTPNPGADILVLVDRSDPMRYRDEERVAHTLPERLLRELKTQPETSFYRFGMLGFTGNATPLIPLQDVEQLNLAGLNFDTLTRPQPTERDADFKNALNDVLPFLNSSYSTANGQIKVIVMITAGELNPANTPVNPDGSTAEPGANNTPYFDEMGTVIQELDRRNIRFFLVITQSKANFDTPPPGSTLKFWKGILAPDHILVAEDGNVDQLIFNQISNWTPNSINPVATIDPNKPTSTSIFPTLPVNLTGTAVAIGYTATAESMATVVAEESTATAIAATETAIASASTETATATVSPTPGDGLDRCAGRYKCPELNPMGKVPPNPWREMLVLIPIVALLGIVAAGTYAYKRFKRAQQDRNRVTSPVGGAVGTPLLQNEDTVRQKIEDAKDEALPKIGKTKDDTLKNITKAKADASQKIKTAKSNALKAQTRARSEAIQKIINARADATDRIRDASTITTVQNIADATATATKSIADDTATTTQKLAEKVVAATQKLADGAAAKLQELADQATAETQEEATKAAAKLQELAQASTETKELATKAATEIQQEATETKSKTHEEAKKIATEIQQEATETKSKTHEEAKKIATEIQQEATETATEIKEKAMQAAKAIKRSAEESAEAQRVETIRKELYGQDGIKRIVKRCTTIGDLVRLQNDNAYYHDTNATEWPRAKAQMTSGWIWGEAFQKSELLMGENILKVRDPMFRLTLLRDWDREGFVIAFMRNFATTKINWQTHFSTLAESDQGKMLLRQFAISDKLLQFTGGFIGEPKTFAVAVKQKATELSGGI